MQGRALLSILWACLGGISASLWAGSPPSVSVRLHAALPSRLGFLGPGLRARLRGGGEAGGSDAVDGGGAAGGPNGEDYILSLDIGTFSTVAAIKTRGGGSAQLVQNDMSLLETPTAIAFRGRKVEVGEVAADTPATNAANQVSGYLPLLGTQPKATGSQGGFFAMAREAPSGTATAEVAFDGGRLGLPLEQAVALQILTMEGYARCQVRTGSAAPADGDAKCSHVAIGVPAAFTERQRAALRDSVDLSGVCTQGSILLVPWHVALTQAYAERHKKELLAACNSTEARAICIVDVGHSSAGALVASFTGLEGACLTYDSVGTVGAGHIDGLLFGHFASELDAAHGKGTCDAPKSRFRLQRACERLKKMLSILDETQVGVDGLLPDAESSIKLSRARLNDMPEAKAMSAELQEMISGVIARSGVPITAVEMVGGGSRVPFIVSAVQAASGLASVGRTLDSANALCVGASIAAAWQLGFLTAADAGAGVRVKGEMWQGGEGMGAERLDAVKERHAELVRLQGELREQEAAMNALQAYIAETRNDMNRKHGDKMDKDATHMLLDAAEEWSWGAPEVGFAEAEYTSRLASLRDEVTALNPAYFEAVKKEHEEAQARLEREAEERRRDEEMRKANGEDEDRDFRKLKFEDRFRMADSNKKEGTELFRDGNFAHAAERYLKALAHVSKMVDVTPTQKEQVDPVKESCYLNLAMCWFKLDKMDKCIDNCGECLSINPGNSKALLRRGLAYERERKLDEALADAKQSLKHAASEEGGDSPTPPASGAAGLKERCEAAIKKQNAAQRDTYSRMFAKS